MRLRRHLLALTLLPLALSLTGCSGRGGGGGSPEANFTPAPAIANAGSRVYFDMRDPKGDDKGGGRYEYPTSFQGRFGFLDIVRFRATDAGSFVAFEVEFRRPISRTRTDGSTEAKNFWLQLLDIYVDTDGRQGSGYQWSLPGRNVVFEESSGWEKMVLVTPGHSRSVIEMLRHRSSEPELMQARYDVLVPERVYPQGYSLKVMVPKDQLGGEPQPHWGYQCFALGYAPENLAHKQFQNMQVQRFTSEQHFGGGNDYQGDPNVLDLLAPSKQEQFRWLSNYASRQYRDANRYAVVPMMRAHVPDRTVFAPESPPASTATPVDPAPLFSSSAAPPPPKPVEIPSKPAKEFAREDPDARYRRSASRVQRDVEIPPEQTRELSSPEFSFELDPGVKE